MLKMLRIIKYWILFCFCFSCKRNIIHGDVDETLPPILKTFETPLNTNSVGFYIGLPYQYGYELTIEKKYPLLVCFPGAGAYGSDGFPRILSYGIPKLVSEHKFPPYFLSGKNKNSFIILAPHFINQPTNLEIKDFILFAKHNYPIDTTRIYFAGVSVGGRMACDYAAEYPNEIAALVNMAGCSDVDIERKGEIIANNNIPVWAFHNRTDEAWPIASQINFITAINNYNPTIPPKLTIFETPEGERNHDAWTRATEPSYKENGQNIYEWMLQYNK